MTNIEKLQEEFRQYCKENKLSYEYEQEEMDLMYVFFDHKLQSEQTRIAEEVEKLQKYTGGSSVEPKDLRVNLDQVLSIIKQGK